MILKIKVTEIFLPVLNMINKHWRDTWKSVWGCSNFTLSPVQDIKCLGREDHIWEYFLDQLDSVQ